MAGPAQEVVSIDLAQLNWLLVINIREGREFIENLSVKQFRQLGDLIDRELSNMEDRKAQLVNLKSASRRIINGER